MWVNPKHANAQPSPAEVEPRGVLLAAIGRGRPEPDGAYREELRVSLDECRGHPFIALRVLVWSQDGTSWSPTEKGCSLRLNEGEEVAAAILEAVRRPDSPQRRQVGACPSADVEGRAGRRLPKSSPLASMTESSSAKETVLRLASS